MAEPLNVRLTLAQSDKLMNLVHLKANSEKKVIGEVIPSSAAVATVSLFLFF